MLLVKKLKPLLWPAGGWTSSMFMLFFWLFWLVLLGFAFCSAFCTAGPST